MGTAVHRAGNQVAVGAGPRPVYCAEPRCGQRDEDSGMGGDRLVDAFAALEAGPDEVAGISPVHGGTSGALREPHALSTTPSGSEALAKSMVRFPPVSVVAKPRSRIGWRHQPQPAPCSMNSWSWCRRE